MRLNKGLSFIEERTSNGKEYFEKDFTAVIIKGMSYSRYELLPAYMSLDLLERWQKINL